MYPDGRTSRTQELQMITVTDPNIHNIALWHVRRLPGGRQGVLQ